jgi:hypothetical protein
MRRIGLARLLLPRRLQAENMPLRSLVSYA